MTDWVNAPFAAQDAEGKATGANFHLLLPQRTFFERLQEQMAREGAAPVTQAWADHPVDRQPAPGAYVIMPDDEREQREGQALAVMKVHESGESTLIMTNQAHRWEEAVEWVEEEAHYAQPVQRLFDYDERDIKERLFQRAKDQTVGRRRFFLYTPPPRPTAKRRA